MTNEQLAEIERWWAVTAEGEDMERGDLDEAAEAIKLLLPEVKRLRQQENA